MDIVVLGHRLRADGTPSAAFRARLDHGARLWQAHTGRIFVTGGNPRAGITEAEAGRRYLQQAHGIPACAIVIEPHARSTFDNARRMSALAPAHALTALTIVASRYQARRAHACFARFFAEVRVQIPPDDPVAVRALLEPLAWLRTRREAQEHGVAL